MRTTSSSASRSVDALVAAGLLDPTRRDEALSVLEDAHPSETAGRQTTGLMSELAGYVGGILVVAAAAVFLAIQWSSMAPAARVGALVIGGLVLAGAGYFATRVGIQGSITDPEHDVRRYLASALLIAGAGVLGAAAGVWASEFTDLVEPRPQTIGFGTVMVLAALSSFIAPTGLAQIATAVPMIFTFATLVFDQFPGRNDAAIFGGLLLAAAVVWGVLAERGVFAQPTLARIITGFLAVIGAQNFVFLPEREWIGYLLLALVGVAGFALYAAAGHWPYLIVGVLALTMAATEAAVDWSNGALGAAGALLVAGVLLLGLSLLGMRMRRKPQPEEAEDQRISP